MPTTYEINAARGIVIVTVTGELTDESLFEMHRHLAGDLAVKPSFAVLYDLRQANGSSVTTDGVRALSDLPLVLSPASRRAVVVPGDLGFGMARMYAMRRGTKGGAVEVFRDFAEASHWIGLEGVG
jgi:hypothetical protein